MVEQEVITKAVIVLRCLEFLLLVVLTTFSFSVFSIPNFLSGENFTEMCSIDAPTASKFNKSLPDQAMTFIRDIGYCNGYVAGAMDNLFLTWGEKKANCWIKQYQGVTTTQLAKILYKYYDNNPRNLNVAPAYVLDFLIKKDFPLPRKCISSK